MRPFELIRCAFMHILACAMTSTLSGPSSSLQHCDHKVIRTYHESDLRSFLIYAQSCAPEDPSAPFC